jgi:hypothetical protein
MNIYDLVDQGLREVETISKNELLSIPEELIRDFTQCLVNFYESGNPVEISQFIYDHCIDEMVFTN